MNTFYYSQLIQMLEGMKSSLPAFLSEEERCQVFNRIVSIQIACQWQIQDIAAYEAGKPDM